MTLKDAQVGSTVKVVKIHGEGAYNAASWIWASRREARFLFEK